jgi:hypothetical protein
VRRRARFLRKARELAYRDLGGLVFNLHRFGQRNDALVLSKLTTLGHIDSELRTLEAALGERATVTVLHEAGITACPRCAAIHSGDDRFCPNCGLSMGRHAELPIAGTPPAGADSTPAGEPAPAASSSGQPGAGSGAAAGATASWPAPSAQAPDAGAGDGTSAPATPAPASAGRSPRPPGDQRPDDSTTAPPAAGSQEDEQTEILHPVEPDR